VTDSQSSIDVSSSVTVASHPAGQLSLLSSAGATGNEHRAKGGDAVRRGE